jgi:hypothetical protein
VGTCEDGSQTCVSDGEFGVWGACVDGIQPTVEACDEADNDCDGCADDGMCCHPWINCSATLDEAAPFTDYVLHGADFLIGSVTTTHWKWELSRGPCDELLGRTTFTMNGAPTTIVEGTPTAARDVTLNFTLSGSYTLTLSVTSLGETMSCSWVINVVAAGMRIETCWDTTGVSDLDLHLGKIGTTADWFAYTTTTTADCFYMNCKETSSGRPNWGYAAVDGHPNPRLDIDNISTVGIPENINLDNPNDGDQFRVLVHYYNSSTTPDAVVHPVVNVYCGGMRKATFGLTPQVEGFDNGNGFDTGDGWKVVDVTWDGDVWADTCQIDPVMTTLGDYVVETGPFTWP